MTMAKPGVKSRYTDAQWEWVVERFREGYTISELAWFLELSKSAVQIHVCGARWEKEPLESFREEFCAIGGNNGKR